VIFSVALHATGQRLIIHSVFIKSLKKIVINWYSAATLHRFEDCLWIV